MYLLRHNIYYLRVIAKQPTYLFTHNPYIRRSIIDYYMC